MSRAMYRYEVPIDDEAHKFTLRGNPVSVAMAASGRAVEFWAEHDTSQSEYDQAFRVFGTGHPLPADAEWIGTCPRTPEGLVFHLYEVRTAIRGAVESVTTDPSSPGSQAAIDRLMTARSKAARQ